MGRSVKAVLKQPKVLLSPRAGLVMANLNVSKYMFPKLSDGNPKRVLTYYGFVMKSTSLQTEKVNSPG